MPVPPFFGDLGKKANDALNKQYQDDLSAKVVTKTVDGSTFESGFTSISSGLQGTVKGTYKNGDCCSGEVNLQANGDKEDKNTNAKLTWKKITQVPGLELSVRGSLIPDAAVTAKYSRESVATEWTVSKGAGDVTEEGSVVVGYQGLSVGVWGLGTLSANPTLNDYKVGFQYADKKYVASAISDAKLTKGRIGYHHTINSSLAVAVELLVNLKSDSGRLLTGGVTYALDATTTVKGKIDTNGAAAVAIERHLSNPSVKINFGHKFDAFKGLKATKWGLGLTFGDY